MLRKGDLVLYYLGDRIGYGSIAIVTKDEYEDETATGTGRACDIDWISLPRAFQAILDRWDMGGSYNVSCFKKIGHIDIPTRPRRKKS